MNSDPSASARRMSAEELLEQAARKRAAKRTDPCIRAENEDDDGYDPYSDRRESTPLFERDPWS